MEWATSCQMSSKKLRNFQCHYTIAPMSRNVCIEVQWYDMMFFSFFFQSQHSWLEEHRSRGRQRWCQQLCIVWMNNLFISSAPLGLLLRCIMKPTYSVLGFLKRGPIVLTSLFKSPFIFFSAENETISEYKSRDIYLLTHFQFQQKSLWSEWRCFDREKGISQYIPKRT